MTKSEALDRLEEEVTIQGSGSFSNINDAFAVAASALNYIMDQVEEEDD